MHFIWPAIWGQVWLSKSYSLLSWHSWHPSAAGTWLVVLILRSNKVTGSCFQINCKKSVVVWNQGFLFFLLQVKRLLNWEWKCWVSCIYTAKIHFSIYWMVNVLSNCIHILNKVTGPLELSSTIMKETKKDLWSGRFLMDRAKGDCLWKCVAVKEIVFTLISIVLSSSIFAFI